MRKDILILFSILLMSQGLSASPVPEPQFNLLSLFYGGGAWVANVVLTPVYRVIRYVYAMSTRVVTQISSSVVTIIKTVNVTVAQNVENFNISCSKAVENITAEFNVFTNESATLNAATTVLCSSALLAANDNMLVIMYGSSCFMNSISGFGPPPPMNSTGPFGDPAPYPTPQSPMPAPPANGAPPPYPPAISVQSRYARTVITRMLSDLLQLTRGVEDFKETTGSTCESVSESQITTIKELFINVTIILTKYENQTATTRLVTVLTSSEIIEINRAITIITETVEFVRNSIRKGVKEVKTSRKPNAYQKIVQEVRENRRTSEEFSKKVTEIRKNNEKSGRRFVGRAFNTARESCNKAYKTVNDARTSLVAQSKVMMKTVRDNGYWIYEYIVKPKLNTCLTKLDTIPICLTTIFSNLNINITTTNNNTEVANNKTYQNATTFISNSITVLTDFIAKDCTCKINCAQAANEDLQEIHCKFHRDAKNCMEQASALNQKAVTNCTNTTIFISQSMNDMVSKIDKCISATGAPNTYYVNFLGYLVRQNVVACLDPIEKKAGNFCTDARALCNGARIYGVSISNQTIESFKNCTNEKVNEAVRAIKIVADTYHTCSKTQPSPPPTTPGPSTTAGSTSTNRSSTTGSSTTGSSTTGSSTTGSSTTGSSTTGSSTTGSSTTSSSTTVSSTTGSSTTGSSTTGSSTTGSSTTSSSTTVSSTTVSSTTGSSTTGSSTTGSSTTGSSTTGSSTTSIPESPTEGP